MRLNLIDLNILKNLYRASKGLDEVNLFRRQRISFADFLTSLGKLQKYKLVECQDHAVRITDEGRQQYISKNPGILSDVRRTWRDVPTNFHDSTIAPETLYIPRISRLDDCFFK